MSWEISCNGDTVAFYGTVKIGELEDFANALTVYAEALRGWDELVAAQGMPAMPETGTGSAPKEGQPGPAKQDAPAPSIND